MSQIARLLALTLPALIAFQALAEGMTLGLSGGWAMATVRGDDTDLVTTADEADRSARQGFFAGLDVGYTLPIGLSFGSGARFVSKGYRVTYKGDSLDGGDSFSSADGDTEEKLNANYLELPLLFGYHANVDDTFHFSLAAGPYVGFLISQSYAVEDENGDSVFTNDVENVEILKGFDFGVEVQARFLAGLSKEDRIGLTVGYSFGMLNVADQDEVEQELNLFDFDAKNSALMLGLAYEHSF
jgi:hypothetical protein